MSDSVRKDWADSLSLIRKNLGHHDVELKMQLNRYTELLDQLKDAQTELFNILIIVTHLKEKADEESRRVSQASSSTNR